MKHCIFTFVLLSGFFTLTAQHIGFLMPAGGQAGETVEILVGGQSYWGVNAARISGEGVKAEAVEVIPGIPVIGGQQRQFMTSWLRNVSEGKDEIPVRTNDPDELETWRQHKYFPIVHRLTPLQLHVLAESIFLPRNPLQMSPAIGNLAIVKVRIDRNAAPGPRELRLDRRGGISNPLTFYVDTLPEVKESYFTVPPRKRLPEKFSVPGVLNGQIMPGETDIWEFSAKKGEKIVFRTFARSLIPFMGDCVPGYFQCLLEIRDSRGTQVAFADDNGNDPDPVLNFTAPADGLYQLRVRDALYRGRADFVYRIRAWHGEWKNRLATPPELGIPCKESASLPDSRMTVYPVLLKGSISAPGAAERFVIQADKGADIVGEIFARRLNSPLDSRLTVYGPDGRKVASNDDYPRIKAGLQLQHTDSYVRFTAPQDGKYTFEVADSSGHGGPEYGYYLRIDRPRPSFRVYVTPSAGAVATNGPSPVTVYTEYLDGFKGDITLKVESPGDFRIAGTPVIPAGTERSVITLTAKASKKREPVQARLSAYSGAIKGECFYGDEATQAFAYTHIIPASEWLLVKHWVMYGGDFFTLANPKQTVVRIRPGKTAQLKLNRRKLPPDSTFEFLLKDAPAGLTLQKTEVFEKAKGNAEIVLTFHAAENLKNLRMNLTVNGIFHYKTKPNREGKVFQRKSQFVLPALRFETGE